MEEKVESDVDLELGTTTRSLPYLVHQLIWRKCGEIEGISSLFLLAYLSYVLVTRILNEYLGAATARIAGGQLEESMEKISARDVDSAMLLKPLLKKLKTMLRNFEWANSPHNMRTAESFEDPPPTFGPTQSLEDPNAWEKFTKTEQQLMKQKLSEKKNDYLIIKRSPGNDNKAAKSPKSSKSNKSNRSNKSNKSNKSSKKKKAK
ncbi:unnamed protein product, partial [Mesorhabditis spiculigera]